MDEKQLTGNSLKVTVRGSGCSAENSIKQELYKPIPEELILCSAEIVDLGSQQIQSKDPISELEKTTSVENGKAKMVQEEGTVHDGADEQMLVGTAKLKPISDEVTFIKADHQNGDAKIDIGILNGKTTFTGMTKEELMRYANDPFWVRLRWIFFIAFWTIWLAMLVGAILIIVQAPKCAAPEPLPWFKQGPLAQLKSIDPAADNAKDLQMVKKIHATGVIYELPPALTYTVKDSMVEQTIVDLVNRYKESNINVILDITPNYVSKQSPLMQQALVDKSKRSPFVWVEQPEVPNNWLSIVNGSAWSEVQPGNFVLSQFGDGLYDLQMNDTIVKHELMQALAHLLNLGVKGFRLKNTKFYLLTKRIDYNEVPSNNPHFIHTQYGFWTHKQTTFQDGLGDVLSEYRAAVRNISADAMFSVTDDIIRPEVYQNKYGRNGIGLPIYGRFTHSLCAPEGKQLIAELENTLSATGNSTWLQWNFGDLDSDCPVKPSAFVLFMSLLPGVPVVPVDSVAFTDNNSNVTYKQVDQLRSTHSFKYGDLQMYGTGGLVAYSRIKSGNPGYFVAFNPTNVTLNGNYGNLGLPDKMTVDVISANYNVADVTTKSKVMTDSIEVSPYSTIILTYVPVQSG